jgi:hypothetical protein
MFLFAKNSSLVLIVFCFFSCKKTFKPANDAYFITTNNVQIVSQPGQGFTSHKITDLWIYTNGWFRGVYPIGSNMPIMLSDGKAVIDVFAGIKNNGISTTRINWPLYEPIKLDTVVGAGENIIRNFAFKYKSAVVFKWLESFELPGFSLIRSSSSDTTYKIHTNDADVFEGNKSIEFGLAGSALSAQLESAVSHSLPLGAESGNVYLEVDYKCNSTFTIGVTSNGAYTEAVTVNPKESWNKIYVQLSNAINTDNSTPYKKIIFRVRRDQTISEQKIYLDNIKLVYL